MALRVLLADESSTIKKVFQLALQDFGVEVRPVNIGVDVASVAKAFKPDIIFADVLLQKKNGYDVCAELKQDAALKAIPIVLMWSGFVDLDEDKFQASHANSQLEKPFDVGALRKIVMDLVPRTKSQNLAQYLTFPKATVEAEKPRTLDGAPEPDVGGEEFKQVSIPKMKGSTGADKYRLNLKPEELDPAHIPVDYALPPDKIAMDELMGPTPPTKGAAPTETVFDEDDEVEEFAMRETKKPSKAATKAAAPKPAPRAAPVEDDEPELDLENMDTEPPPTPHPKASAAAKASAAESAGAGQGGAGQISAEQLEKIIRQQSAEVIESVVWKVVPELAAQIIERELNKLLKERDSNPY